MKRGWPWLLLACGSACAGAANAPVQQLDDRTTTPLHPPVGRVHVLVFTSQECPIANGYTPTLQTLAAAWRDQPVDLFLVHVDPQLTPAAAAAHAADYGLPGTVLLDPAQTLARTLGITRTPEAAMLTAGGLAYRGRIDDRWAGLGQPRPEAGQHDLADAVTATLAALAAAPAAHIPFRAGPPAIGCWLPEPRR